MNNEIIKNIDEASILRNINKMTSPLQSAITDVIKFSNDASKASKGAREIITDKAFTKSAGTINPKIIPKGTKITNFDEFKDAINGKALSPATKNQIEIGLLKSGSLPLNSVSDVVKNLVGSKVFLQKYGNVANKGDLIKQLQANGYNKIAIDEIMLQLKPKTGFFGGLDLGKKVTTKKPTPNSPAGGNTIGEKIKNAYKVVKDSKIVRYVILPGAGIAGVVAYFSDGTKIELDDKYSDEVKNLLNPCLLPLLDMGGVIEPVADGARLILKKTGNAEDDSKGGIVYYPNGRAHTMDQSQKGTWSCTNIVKEEVMKPVTLKEAIRFRLKNLLNEEVDELQLVQDVDKMVNLLDMYSSANDLKNAFELLTKYSTETINGKNAGKVFLEKYKSAGLGGFVGINSSVSDSVRYIIAINGDTKYYKNQLLNLVKNIESGKIVAKPTASGKANNSVTIKWDKDSVSDKSTSTSTSSSTQPKQQMTYKLKYGFPYFYGDKSEDIRKIQEKLEFERRYITGNFGPVTQKKLKEVESKYGFVLDDNIGITPDIYKKIMGTDSKSQPSSGEEKQSQDNITNTLKDVDKMLGKDSTDTTTAQTGTTPATTTASTSTDTTAQTGTTAQIGTTAQTQQPKNTNRDVIIKNLKARRFRLDGKISAIVYRGNSLNQSDEEFLLNYINEKYGEDGKYKFEVRRNTEKTQKGEDVIVYEKSRNN